MKQKEYRILITDEQKQKNYPNGYFDSIVRKNNSLGNRIANWFVFIFLGVILNIGFLIGIPVALTNGFTLSFFICVAVGIAQFLLCTLILRSGKKARSKTRETWIAETVTNSHCQESEVREFDQQFMNSDSYFLTLNGKIDNTLPYFLTEDFILIGAKIAPVVLPIQSLLGVCFAYKLEFYSDFKGRLKTRDSLAVGLCTKDLDYAIFADQNLGKEFIAMLKEKNPNMAVREGEILKEEDFNAWVKELQAANRV
ncbi:MAG: hypothetical protein J1E35_07790 [Lachnospiraceae bacterium]|nr:hypothetical protein [Lachnospiraceae bacterium]